MEFASKVRPESLGSGQVRAVQALLNFLLQPVEIDTEGLLLLFPASKTVADDFPGIHIVAVLDLVSDEFVQLGRQFDFHNRKLLSAAMDVKVREFET